MNESVKELIAIGASVGAHCEPCLEYHIQTAVELGVSAEDIRQAVEIGHRVENGAMSAMKKISAAAVNELVIEPAQNSLAEKESDLVSEGKRDGTVLKIYDPAMCCSSGVCGPGVDPVLVQFAGAVKAVSDQPGVRVERYNLSQQPKAFAENEEVRSLLGNDGDKRLPFIFINDRLWLQGRYPSREELSQALNLEIQPIALQMTAEPCCGEEGCCG